MVTNTGRQTEPFARSDITNRFDDFSAHTNQLIKLEVILTFHINSGFSKRSFFAPARCPKRKCKTGPPRRRSCNSARTKPTMMRRRFKSLTINNGLNSEHDGVATSSASFSCYRAVTRAVGLRKSTSMFSRVD